jgi:DNA-binding CsgD family transcriptional regulator
LIDRLQSLTDCSLQPEDRPLLSAIVVDPTTFYQNETLGHLSIGFHRNQSSFTDRDLSILTILSPHIQIAYRNSQQYTKIQHQLKNQSQVLDRLKAIVLTVSGEVQMISTSAASLLDRYLDGEWINTNHLPDPLNSWVKQQLTLQQSNLIVSTQPWRSEKNGHQLKIDLLCDFPAEQHLLICTEQSINVSPIEQFQSIGLSKREAEVLALVAAGKTNPQISQQLTISVKTVKKHLEHIFGKLNATSRNNAVNKAFQKP